MNTQLCVQTLPPRCSQWQSHFSPWDLSVLLWLVSVSHIAGKHRPRLDRAVNTILQGGKRDEEFMFKTTPRWHGPAMCSGNGVRTKFSFILALAWLESHSGLKNIVFIFCSLIRC